VRIWQNNIIIILSLYGRFGTLALFAVGLTFLSLPFSLSPVSSGMYQLSGFCGSGLSSVSVWFVTDMGTLSPRQPPLAAFHHSSEYESPNQGYIQIVLEGASVPVSQSYQGPDLIVLYIEFC
ncbi:hypothetical protein ADUPG1_010966, partial [Aduncisulcus paluster]